jgi:RNA polymerase sigma-70 factor (ECF subfamily)
LLSLFRQAKTTQKGFELILKKYQEKLYWHIRKMVIVHEDADDVLQNTWLKVWKGLANFRADSGLYTWLYRIATNECISFLNKKRMKYSKSEEDLEKALSDDLESDTFYSGDEIQTQLQKAILTLPEKQRLVFNMRYFDQMKYNDMAGILGTSIGALKASYHHAVKKIEKFITG